MSLLALVYDECRLPTSCTITFEGGKGTCGEHFVVMLGFTLIFASVSFTRTLRWCVRMFMQDVYSKPWPITPPDTPSSSSSPACDIETPQRCNSVAEAKRNLNKIYSNLKVFHVLCVHSKGMCMMYVHPYLWYDICLLAIRQAKICDIHVHVCMCTCVTSVLNHSHFANDIDVCELMCVDS